MDPQTEDNTWGTASQPQPGAVNSERQCHWAGDNCNPGGVGNFVANSEDEPEAPKPGKKIASTFSEFGTEIVHVEVGPRKVRFTVHKKLLCTSEVFDAMLNSGFKEGLTGHVHLEDDDPVVFSWFNESLYRKLPDHLIQTEMEVMEVYCFAAKYRCKKLMREIMLYYNSWFWRGDRDVDDVDEEVLNYLYDNCPGSSCMKGYLANKFAHALLNVKEGNGDSGDTFVDKFVALGTCCPDLLKGVLSLVRGDSANLLSITNEVKEMKWAKQRKGRYRGDYYPKAKFPVQDATAVIAQDPVCGNEALGLSGRDLDSYNYNPWSNDQW